MHKVHRKMNKSLHKIFFLKWTSSYIHGNLHISILNLQLKYVSSVSNDLQSFMSRLLDIEEAWFGKRTCQRWFARFTLVFTCLGDSGLFSFPQLIVSLQKKKKKCACTCWSWQTSLGRHSKSELAADYFCTRGNTLISN